MNVTKLGYDGYWATYLYMFPLWDLNVISNEVFYGISLYIFRSQIIGGQSLTILLMVIWIALRKNKQSSGQWNEMPEHSCDITHKVKYLVIYKAVLQFRC